MAAWDKRLLWSVVLMLAAAAAEGQRPSVTYPPDVCGFRGSTVLLPCSFSPLTFITTERGWVPVEIIRVVWCQNHEVCQGSTPSVYDSEEPGEKPRYRYLGDLRRNCTLQISDLKMEDQATLRFRMEANDWRAHWAGQPGVSVTVVETPMKIETSGGDAGIISLLCTSSCSFHHLEVTWFRDGHALCESGPALRLSLLTPEHSGNYTCSLKNMSKTLSEPFPLKVEGEKETGPADFLLPLRFLLFALHTMLFITITFIIIRRLCQNSTSSAGEETFLNNSSSKEKKQEVV